MAEAVTPEEYGAHLFPCPGEAHQNAHIDNCGLCAPRWGQLLAHRALSPSARFVLRAICRLPAGQCTAIPFRELNELVAMKLAVEMRYELRRTTTFYVLVPTDLGRAAYNAMKGAR